MKTLVTGATGLLGSELTRQLVDAGEDVRILRRASSSLDLLGDAARRVEHAVGDVTEAEDVHTATEGVQRVYHVAAYVSVGGREDRERLRAVNVVGTANVVNAALWAGAQRMVHTSSIAALGRPDAAGAVLDESAEWVESRANTAYARSKYLAELEVHRGVAEGLDAVIVNPALIFGFSRAGENTRQIAERVRDGRLPGMPSGGTNVVDVKDVASVLVSAMDRGATGERYLAAGENLSWVRIIQILAEAFDVAPPSRLLRPSVAVAAGAVAEWFGTLTRTQPLLTRSAARAASAIYRYDNSRAIEALGCTFRPFADTARRLAAELSPST